ncbi:MAG TPA: metal ABC transporter substrate-binding protein [Anaerolineales bacterium]|jgi:ABC-type Zn uptake system ZnuABC Zn-binding protein ZnuA
MLKKWLQSSLFLLVAVSLLLAACATTPAARLAAGPVRVLAVETFLADIAQNVAGERLQVEALLPVGVDPHGYQPTPQDVIRLADSQLLITNGAGYEGWLAKTLDNAGGQRRLVQASDGLSGRVPSSGELLDPDHASDPHFWMDPNNVITYAANIRDALTALDPSGAAIYAQNTANYILRLKDLDSWIREQVSQIPPERRLLVTNHESLGYFADRYGFTITGTVIPSTSSEAAPSAQQMAALIDRIKQVHVKAIFLETGTNPQLATQIAQETGLQVITGLYTESLSSADGEAPTYIEMIKHDVALLSILK